MRIPGHVVARIEKRVPKNGINGDEILEKFWGWEEQNKKFLDTHDGFCYNCGMAQRKEVERFNCLKFNVKQSSNVVPLKDLTREYCRDGASILEMKCSYC